MKFLTLISSFIFSIFTTQALAADIAVEEAWARATAPGQEVGMAGVMITSKTAVRLISVQSSAAASTEIHTMTMDNGVMQMRQLEDLQIPASDPVILGPGSDHIMLIGLKKQLKPGQKIPLTFTFALPDKSTRKIRINAAVREVKQGGHHH